MRLPIKVSGVIPSYNHEKYISDSLESLYSQVDELVVVDDQSNDRSWEIITKFSKHKKNVIKIRNETNLGISYSLNQGIKAASGDLLLLQGSDDVSLSGRRELQEQIFNKFENVVLSFCHPEAIDSDGNIIENGYGVGFELDTLGISNFTKKLFIKGNSVCAPSVALRKKSLNKTGLHLINVDQFQDFALWLHLSLIGDFHFGIEPFIQYRIHGTNTSRFISDETNPIYKLREFEYSYIILEFIKSLNREQTKLLAKKLDVEFIDSYSLSLNKIQIKRLINNKYVLDSCRMDAYGLSQNTSTEEIKILREIINSGFLFITSV